MSGNTHNLFQEAQVMYQGHVSNIGWQSRVSDEQAVGTTGQGLSMEAACIRQHDPEYSGSISYRVGCTYQVFFVKYFSLKKASEFPFFSKGFSLPSAGIMHPCA